MEVDFLENADKSGRVKMTLEVEINQALMDLAREKMDTVMQFASQMRQNMGPGGKGKMGEGHAAMMGHGQE